jgi:hypothetical protein
MQTACRREGSVKIKQLHKGHEIRFSEDSEEWICDAFGFSNKSLKALRAAINRADKKNRTMAVPALYLSESHWEEPKLHDCTIVLLRSDGRANAHIKIKGEHDTERVELRELYPPVARKKLEEYVKIKCQETELGRKAESIKEDLECFTAKSLREAIVTQADEAA